MHTKAVLSRREARWNELFQQFRFQWKHKPGAQNMADAISRLPTFKASQHDHIAAFSSDVAEPSPSHMLAPAALRRRPPRPQPPKRKRRQPKTQQKATPGNPTAPGNSSEVATVTPQEKTSGVKRPTPDLDHVDLLTEIKEGYEFDPWFASPANTNQLNRKDELYVLEK
jgi:hypothetical protein